MVIIGVKHIVGYIQAYKMLNHFSGLTNGGRGTGSCSATRLWPMSCAQPAGQCGPWRQCTCSAPSLWSLIFSDPSFFFSSRIEYIAMHSLAIQILVSSPDSKHGLIRVDLCTTSVTSILSLWHRLLCSTQPHPSLLITHTCRSSILIPSVPHSLYEAPSFSSPLALSFTPLFDGVTCS